MYIHIYIYICYIYVIYIQTIWDILQKTLTTTLLDLYNGIAKLEYSKSWIYKKYSKYKNVNILFLRSKKGLVVDLPGFRINIYNLINNLTLPK